MKHWLIQDTEAMRYRVIAENNVAVSAWSMDILGLFSTSFTLLDPSNPTHQWDSRYTTLNRDTVIEPIPGSHPEGLQVIKSFDTKPTLELIQSQYPELLL